jgi:hypothetical protein
MRHMIAARCNPVLENAAKSPQDPALLPRSPPAAFAPQLPELPLQRLQFRDPLFHVTDMGVQKRVDLPAILIRRGAKSEQNTDFVQRHVQGTAVANERQQFGVVLPIASKVPARPARFWQQSFMLVVPNRFDSASRSPRKFAYGHWFGPSFSFNLTL